MRAILLAGFAGQRQQQRRWCWAAACASIRDYYRTLDPTLPVLHQAQIVDAQFGRCDCGRHPASIYCDQDGRLDHALQAARHDGSFVPPGHKFAMCREEIDAGRPVAVRVRTAENTQHFVVIYGYAPNLGLLAWDPASGTVRTNLNDWRSRIGSWENTYRTVPRRRGGTTRRGTERGARCEGDAARRGAARPVP